MPAHVGVAQREAVREERDLRGVERRLRHVRAEAAATEAFRKRLLTFYVMYNHDKVLEVDGILKR